MRQSIVTYFIGPTNVKGPRIKAKASGGSSVTLSWDHAMDIAGNHRAAAKALAEKLDWSGEFVAGGMADGARVFVDCSGEFGDGFRSGDKA
jgi:hypothetical protein